MGVRRFTNADAHRHLDVARGLSPADQRYNAQQVAEDDARLSGLMSRQYEDTVSRSQGYLDSIKRLRESGVDNIRADIEAYKRGELSDEELGERLTTYSAETNKLRPLLTQAQQSEESAWTEINVTPAEYQAQAFRRFPALRMHGRNQIALVTGEDD